MTNVRFTRDDLIPFLESQGVAAQLRKWMARNPPDEILTWIISDWSGLQQLSTRQVKQLIADLTQTKKLEWGDISGDSLPAPIIRPNKPSGMAIASGSVSVTAPTVSPYLIRFYVDGELKQSSQNMNTAALTALGAVAGQKIQACQVALVDVIENDIVITKAGTVGWWAKITVS